MEDVKNSNAVGVSAAEPAAHASSSSLSSLRQYPDKDPDGSIAFAEMRVGGQNYGRDSTTSETRDESASASGDGGAGIGGGVSSSSFSGSMYGQGVRNASDARPPPAPRLYPSYSRRGDGGVDQGEDDEEDDSDETGMTREDRAEHEAIAKDPTDGKYAREGEDQREGRGQEERESSGGYFPFNTDHTSYRVSSGIAPPVTDARPPVSTQGRYAAASVALAVPTAHHDYVLPQVSFVAGETTTTSACSPDRRPKTNPASSDRSPQSVMYPPDTDRCLPTSDANDAPPPPPPQQQQQPPPPSSSSSSYGHIHPYHHGHPPETATPTAPKHYPVGAPASIGNRASSATEVSQPPPTTPTREDGGLRPHASSSSSSSYYAHPSSFHYGGGGKGGSLRSEETDPCLREPDHRGGNGGGGGEWNVSGGDTGGGGNGPEGSGGGEWREWDGYYHQHQRHYPHPTDHDRLYNFDREDDRMSSVPPSHGNTSSGQHGSEPHRWDENMAGEGRSSSYSSPPYSDGRDSGVAHPRWPDPPGGGGSNSGVKRGGGGGGGGGADDSAYFYQNDAPPPPTTNTTTADATSYYDATFPEPFPPSPTWRNHHPRQKRDDQWIDHRHSYHSGGHAHHAHTHPPHPNPPSPPPAIGPTDHHPGHHWDYHHGRHRRGTSYGSCSSIDTYDYFLPPPPTKTTSSSSSPATMPAYDSYHHRGEVPQQQPPQPPPPPPPPLQQRQPRSQRSTYTLEPRPRASAAAFASSTPSRQSPPYSPCASSPHPAPPLPSSPSSRTLHRNRAPPSTIMSSSSPSSSSSSSMSSAPVRTSFRLAPVGSTVGSAVGYDDVSAAAAAVGPTTSTTTMTTTMGAFPNRIVNDGGGGNNVGRRETREETVKNKEMTTATGGRFEFRETEYVPRRQFATPHSKSGRVKFNPPLSAFRSSPPPPPPSHHHHHHHHPPAPASSSSSSSMTMAASTVAGAGGGGGGGGGGATVRTISITAYHPGMRKIMVRKKCPWKHYPELEDFLISNREEYLRHSAMNYTSQQRQYNNRLTERLLEVASRHGYVFDEADFDFVAVRDRIRCYYKSYVQSARKRGVEVVVGSSKKRKLVGSTGSACEGQGNNGEQQ